MHVCREAAISLGSKDKYEEAGQELEEVLSTALKQTREAQRKASGELFRALQMLTYILNGLILSPPS